VAGARDVYGVVVVDGEIDEAATAAARDRHRDVRRARSTVSNGTGGTTLDPATGRRLDDNLVEVSVEGRTLVACRHCGEQLGEPDHLGLATYEGPTTDAGPQIRTDPADYVDAPVVFRQYCCPRCWTAIYSAVVPADHVDHMRPERVVRARQ
jgi:N-methylhydantoinase B